jgi:hypothetical protein
LKVTADLAAMGSAFKPSLAWQYARRDGGELQQTVRYADPASGAGDTTLAIQGIPDEQTSVGLGLAYNNKQGMMVHSEWVYTSGSSQYRANALQLGLTLLF